MVIRRRLNEALARFGFFVNGIFGTVGSGSIHMVGLRSQT